MIENYKKNQIHIIFFFLISLNYLIPLSIFGEITLFYHDALDSEIVYNKIIGKIFKEDFKAAEIFLNGEIKAEYLRRLFQPFSVFYYFFNAEVAYWIIDFLVKITSYLSFYVLAKKLSGEKFTSSLVACLFACINYRSQDGFGIAIMPYIIYLISFKQNLNLKNFVLIIFAGLNTDFPTCIPQIPIIAIIAYILNVNNSKIFISNLFKIISTFVLFILVSNINLIYSFLFLGDFHRDDFFFEPSTLLNSFASYFKSILGIPSYNWTLFKLIPEFLLYSSILIFSIFENKKKLLKIIILILLANSFIIFNNLQSITDLKNSSEGIFKSFNLEYMKWVTPILFLILLSILLKNNNYYKKYLKVFYIMTIILFQISSSVVPFAKKYLIKENNYRNLYTFNEYYMYDDYFKIKNLVGENKVMSIGYDPMIAIMNNINTIDGYHNIYPLKYKFQFRKIIQKELENDLGLKKYYDNYGSRVYVFVNDPNNINIDFTEAKKIGAEFIISKYIINLPNIELVSDKFKYKKFLYKIR